MRISEAVFRELKLVREMRAGKATLGGCFVPQDGRLEKPPA
jgi:hypothetical protein